MEILRARRLENSLLSFFSSFSSPKCIQMHREGKFFKNSSPSFDAQGHDLKVDDDIVSKVRVASRSGFFESARVESREGQYRCTAQPGGRCRRYYVFDVKVKVSPAADTDDADARVAHSSRAPSRRRRRPRVVVGRFRKRVIIGIVAGD